MKSACSDITSFNRTNLSAQAGNDQDVRQNPDAGKSQSIQQLIPTVDVDNDRQAIARPALLFPPQQELTNQIIPGAQHGKLSASQPVLRGLEAAESAHESGNGTMDVPGRLSQQEPGPTLCAQAIRIPGRPSLEQSSESRRIQQAVDQDYRGELTAWVESADLSMRAVHQETERRIDAFLETSTERRKLINLSQLCLSTLPPLPAGLTALDVKFNKLTLLPENLPQGLQKLDAYGNELTALPEHLPHSLQRLCINFNTLTALPRHLPRGLQELYVSNNSLTVLPEHLPQDLRELHASNNNLTVLPEHLPQDLRELHASNNNLTVLPKHLPQDLQALRASSNKLTALPEHLPRDLLSLYASNNKLSALSEHLPRGLLELHVNDNNLTALPQHLPQGLQELDVSGNQLTALPEHLPQGLQNLCVASNKLNALPENLPQNLKLLSAAASGLNAKTLVALMRSNASITELALDWHNIDVGSKQKLVAELVNNREHPARLLKAAVTLDLLTRFGLTTSDQTDTLLMRDSTPSPVANRLPEQSIPAELHDVLTANFPKDVLAVLAGMVNGTAQYYWSAEPTQ